MGEHSASVVNMCDPQPPPKRGGCKVGKELIDYVWRIPKLRRSQCITLQEQVEARTAYGKAKYGQVLMTQDGRDEVIDAEQELIDLIQYAYKARLNNRRKEAAQRLGAAMTVLVAILTNDEDDYDEDYDSNEENEDEPKCPPTPTDG